MEETCPKCRHVVNVEGSGSSRCGNCGATVTLQSAADAHSSAGLAASERPADPPPATTDASSIGTGVVRPASVASFVLAILFFVPIVPQILAIGFGFVALFRRRKPDERITLAWIGLVLGLLALVGWLLVGPALLSGAGKIRLGATSSSVVQPNHVADWEATSRLIETMERVHRAASTYRRDFRTWPPDVDTLVGQWLPRGFHLPSELSFRPVPPAQAASATWILIVSDAVNVDANGETLAFPHRLVLRLGGTVELLPATEVAKLLSNP